MSQLTLILKKKYFDQILSGEKTEEYREIRPKNVNRYCEIENDTLIGPKKYDTIQFFTGYETGRPSMIVEVKDAFITLFDDDQTGEPLTYEVDGETYVESEITYQLGSIISKHNC